MISCIWNKVKENDTFLFCHNKKTDDLTKNVTFLLGINVQNAQKKFPKLWKTWKIMKSIDRKWKELYNYGNRWKHLKQNENKCKQKHRKEGIMNYAGRFNSFILKGQNVFDAIKAYHEMDGITHLEFNYPEHFAGYDLEEIKKAIGDLKVNGLAVRWRNYFTNGDFTNPDEELRTKAIQYCKEAADICRELGGTYITLWMENDGFDYAFQLDYEEAWNQLIDAFREVADYAPDLKISIEYKPFEPRNFSMIDSTGMTLLLIKEIDRPNVGCTLDFCHMLMKRDSPAYGLAIAASMGKLYGLHMNDGYSQMDSGMIFGSVNIAHAAEFIYYLKKYNYQGVVFFDTFPIRENAKEETQANIDSFEKISKIIDEIGMDRIAEVVSKRDGVEAHRLVLDMLK